MLFLLVFLFLDQVLVVFGVVSLRIPQALSESINQGYGVEYCIIPKTGSTITRRILCDVLQEYKGIAYKQELGVIRERTQCANHANYFYALGKKWQKSPKTVKFTIVRDPIERFVSMYGHLCVLKHECPKHVRNVHQFARWVYELQKENINNKAVWLKSSDVLHHTSPQTSWCNLKQKKQILVHYSRNRRKMAREMMRVFRRARVPKRVAEKALRHLYQTTTKHANRNDQSKKRLEKAITQNPQTMRYLRAVYHQDFKLLKNHEFN